MPVVDPVSVLARSPLFAGLEPEVLEALAPALRERNFRRGDHIFREGDPGSALFFIESGTVKIGRAGTGGDEAIFAVLSPGDFFGELALLHEGLRTADAQALEDTSCLSLPRDAVMDLMDAHPRVMKHLLQQLSAYIVRKDETFAEIAFLDIPGRVARKLLELGEERGEPGPEGIRIAMRLSQRTLAGLVVASRENVNRALNSFARRGYIKVEGGVITILKPAELRKVS
jgi:CRP-like cAMP-binding protein